MYVVPERRGKGLIQVIIKYNTRKFVEYGMVPNSMILEDNINSIKAMQRTPGGAWVKSEIMIQVVECHPKEKEQEVFKV